MTESSTVQGPAKSLRFILLGPALVILLVVVGVRVESSTRPVLLAGPMVQIPAGDTLAFVWDVDAWRGEGEVILRSADGQETEHPCSRRGTRCEVAIAGLSPGESYRYEIAFHRPLFGRFVLAGPFETKTPPTRGRPFRFVAFGDSGNGSYTQEQLASLVAAARPDVVIHVGDLVYPAGRMEDYLSNFFRPNAALIRTAPFMASLGNHDAATDHGRPLLDVFVLPRNGPADIEPERNYYFDYGDARFVALDSNPPEEQGILTAAQREGVVAPWLRRVLSACDANWKFVYFHHPFYTGGQHPESGGNHMKVAFLSVLESCGVDVVFCGHNHLYERTAPLRAERVTADGQGVVYVTTGAGGTSRYAESRPPPAYLRAFADDVFSFTQVDLTANRFHLRQIDENGKQIDEYVLDKPPRRVAASIEGGASGG